MAERKRKGGDPAVVGTRVSKRSKKSSGDTTSSTKQDETTLDPQVTGKALKQPRKRAVDFLDDEQENTPPKKSKKVVVEFSLAEEGENGVAEDEKVEEINIITGKKPKQNSMMAEAARTQDEELTEEFGGVEDSEDDELDAAPALLAGFDSDNDDPAEDKDVNTSRVAPIPQYKKTSKKLRKAKEIKNDGPGVVYVGRIPHGFYESQMREYFSQFGDISRLRLSRNKRTGASKHFAFIEFHSNEVAKIVAETMDNYLMFGHILKCKYAPDGTLHEDVWKGANKKFRQIPHHKLARAKAEQPKSEAQMDRKLLKEQKKREAKAAKLKALGYEYVLPELKKPDIVTKLVENEIEGALIPPPTVPKDEVAAKVEEKLKPPKKSKKMAQSIVSDVPVTKQSGADKNKAEMSVAVATSPKPQIDEKPAKDKNKKKASLPAAKAEKASNGKQLKGILKKPKKA